MKQEENIYPMRTGSVKNQKIATHDDLGGYILVS
jgi:hypothetical protein